MKRKIIVIAASIAVLAVLVVVGISAQSGKAVATEQTDGNIPENCKKCPSASTCLDATDQTTASECEGNTSACDKSQCDKCDKKATCTKNAAGANKECPHKSTVGCVKKSDAQGCTKSAECKKDCEKKSK